MRNSKVKITTADAMDALAVWWTTDEPNENTDLALEDAIFSKTNISAGETLEKDFTWTHASTYWVMVAKYPGDDDTYFLTGADLFTGKVFNPFYGFDLDDGATMDIMIKVHGGEVIGKASVGMMDGHMHRNSGAALLASKKDIAWLQFGVRMVEKLGKLLIKQAMKS